MQTLLVIDAQNEFSAHGLRPVPNHTEALHAIRWRVAQARQEGRPIVWVRHHNRPDESRAFVPGSWGAAFSPGLGPLPERRAEVDFVKDVSVPSPAQRSAPGSRRSAPTRSSSLASSRTCASRRPRVKR